MGPFKYIDLSVKGAIATITYTTPTLTIPMLKDLLAALTHCTTTDSIRIIITTGRDKFYTAGLDLLNPDNGQADAMISDAFVHVLTEIQEMMITTNKILIAAVNGIAPGWGTSSLALYDLVYVVEDAVFFTPFVQWGICAEACSSVTFRKTMGRQRASALLLAGQKMTSRELEAAGMVTKVCDKEGFMGYVMGVARDMEKLPAETLLANKELMMRGYRDELLERARLETEVLMERVRGPESKKAIGGFREETERRRREKKAKEAGL